MSKQKPINSEKEIVKEEPTSVSAEVVDCTKLNIRRSPDSKAPVIGTLSLGERVVVNLTEKFSDYYEILSNSGKKGYCVKMYLKLID